MGDREETETHTHVMCTEAGVTCYSVGLGGGEGGGLHAVYVPGADQGGFLRSKYLILTGTHFS